MKRISLLALLCCISSSNIFSSEKGQTSFNKREDQRERELLDWNKQKYEQLKQEEEINAIAQLKRDHQKEIALYEEKITSMQLQLEKKDQQIENRDQQISLMVEKLISNK